MGVAGGVQAWSFMEERLRSGYTVLGCGRRGSPPGELRLGLGDREWSFLAGTLPLLVAAYTSELSSLCCISEARKELREMEGRGEIRHSQASKNYHKVSVN